MQKLLFKITLKASPEKVWNSLWEIENYKKWTGIFCQGSYYVTESFTQGNKIHLLAPNGGGMYSILDQVIENKLLVFRHIGELKDFKEQPIDTQTQIWTNALESYQLTPFENSTELQITVDTIEDYVDLMNNTFPKALEVLKTIAESN